MEEFGVAWPALNEGIKYSDTVFVADPGESVLDYYFSRYNSSASRDGWLSRIVKGQIERAHSAQITINGEVATSGETIIKSGDKLSYQRLPWREPDAPYRLQVLYEDEHLLAVNKPSGLQVLPAGLFQQRTVLSQLQWREKLLEIPHSRPVHRLGRGTSGVLLCAKTKEARSSLASKLAPACNGTHSAQITKIYRALVRGLVQNDELMIDHPIGRIRYPGVKDGLYVASSKGKPSQTKVKVLERNPTDNLTLLEVEIFSGRPHQIRIHLAFIGYPLLGDPLYAIGGKPSIDLLNDSIVDCGVAEDGGHERTVNPLPGDCGYHLHAHKLLIDHPVALKAIQIVAPVPPILQEKSSTC